MANPRTASITAKYNDKDATAKISDNLESFVYTDVASGESDSISFRLADVDKKWIGKWKPKKGDAVSATIVTKNWSKDGENKKLNCGSFTIDEYSYTARPLTIAIDAISTPATEGFCVTENTKQWNNATIKAIATEIAKKHSLKLVYEADSIKIETIEQSTKTDCSFLYEICQTYGLAMKVFAKKIIIFDEGVYEKKKSVVTLAESDMITWEYTSTLTGSYNAAEITYTDIFKDADISVKIGAGKRILKITDQADNLKDAELKAIAGLNNANKKAVVLRLTTTGNTNIVASANVKIKGLGKLDGKYAVDKVTHEISGGYKTKLELRLIYKRLSIRDKLDVTTLLEECRFSSSSADAAGIDTDDDTNTAGSTGIGDYTVKRGDNLWSISKQHYGTGANMSAIYNLNKDKIESMAKQHGKSNSGNGKWIWAGTVLKMPDKTN